MPSGSERASLISVASSGVPMQSSGTHVGLEELSGGAQGFTPRQVTHTSQSAVSSSAHRAQHCLPDVDANLHIVRTAIPEPLRPCALSNFSNCCRSLSRVRLMAWCPCHPGDTCPGSFSAALETPCSSMAAAAGGLTARHLVKRPPAATHAHVRIHRQACSPLGVSFLHCKQCGDMSAVQACHLCSSFTLPRMQHCTLGMKASGMMVSVSGRPQGGLAILLQYVYPPRAQARALCMQA